MPGDLPELRHIAKAGRESNNLGICICLAFTEQSGVKCLFARGIGMNIYEAYQ